MKFQPLVLSLYCRKVAKLHIVLDREKLVKKISLKKGKECQGIV